MSVAEQHTSVLSDTRCFTNVNQGTDSSAPSRRQTPDETIEVLESEIREDIVDLTCENSFVDLTSYDSGHVVIVDESPYRRERRQRESYVLSSDEEQEPVANRPGLIPAARSTTGAIHCPICMDSYNEIVDSGRIVVSSQCGHLFCSTCIRESLVNSKTCPTCRMKLNHKQYHPIYI